MKHGHRIPGITIIFLIVYMAFPLLQQGTEKPMYLFYNLPYGARALGMGNAFTGIADDLTAVYTNPAGIAGIQFPRISLEYRKDDMSYNHSAETLTDSTYSKEYNYGFTGSLKNLNFFSIAAPVNFWDLRWSFALSYYRYIPYGINGRFTGKLTTTANNDTWTDSTWKVIDGQSGIDVLALSGAFHIMNELSFGVTLQKFFNNGDISYNVSGQQMSYIRKYSEKLDGWGLIMGMLFRLDENISLGFTYQTRFSSTLSTDITYTDLLTNSNPVTTSDESTLKIPPRFSAGMMIKPFKHVRFGFDYSIIYWSKASLSGYFDNTETLQYPVRDDFSFSQKDNVALRMGTEIDIPMKWMILYLRGGIFSEKQLFTDIANNAAKVKGFSLGLGIELAAGLRMDMGYMKQNAKWQEASYFDATNVVNTKLKNNVLCVSVSYEFGRKQTN